MDMDYNNASVFFNCSLLAAAVSSCPAVELMFLVTGVTLSRMIRCIFLQTSLVFSHSHTSGLNLSVLIIFIQQ